MDLDALMAAIDGDPDDEARYLVLADALLEAGDARGELISLQAERARRPDDRELAAAEAAALRVAWGELAQFRRDIVSSSWRLGFLDAVEVNLYGGKTREAIASLCRSPVSRWLRTLSVSRWPKDLDPAVVTERANLRSLHVDDAEAFAEGDVHRIAAMPRLTELSLSSANLGAPAIANLPGRIEKLTLAWMKGLGDDDLAATARIASLRELTLRKLFRLSGSFAARLGDGLRAFTMRQCDITPEVVRGLATRRLESINMWPHGVIDGADLGRFEHETLQDVNIWGVNSLELALAGLATHPGMRAIALSGYDKTPIRAETVARVLALPQLRKLWLEWSGPIEGTSAIESAVTDLYLQVDLAPALARQLLSLPLTQLRLGGYDERGKWVIDDTLAQIGANPRLEELHLTTARITDVGLRHLHGLPQLAKLDLGHCTAITNAGVAELVMSLPALRVLELGGASIDSIAGLTGHPTLAELTVGTTLGPDVLTVAASLPQLRVLSVFGCKLADADLAALLPLAGTLRRLDLGNCGITEAAAPILAQLYGLELLKLPSRGGKLAELHDLLPNCRIE